MPLLLLAEPGGAAVAMTLVAVGGSVLVGSGMSGAVESGASGVAEGGALLSVSVAIRASGSMGGWACRVGVNGRRHDKCSSRQGGTLPQNIGDRADGQ